MLKPNSAYDHGLKAGEGEAVGKLELPAPSPWLPLTSFAAVYVRPTWTHASSRGPVPVLVTGVSPMPAPDLEQLTAGSAVDRH